MTTLTFRRLDALNSIDQSEWRQAFRGAPSFTYATEGRRPTDADADHMIEMLPNGKSAADVYIFVCVWPWHLELTWPAREHRVHGEHGGCGLVEGNGICRSLARRYRAGRVHHRSSGGSLGPALCVGPVDPGGFSLQAATGGAATPRSGCSTASAAE